MMPRLRRYRVFLVFAVISILAFVQFTGVKDWTSSVPQTQQDTTQGQGPTHQNQNQNQNQNSPPPPPPPKEQQPPSVQPGTPADKVNEGGVNSSPKESNRAPAATSYPPVTTKKQAESTARTLPTLPPAPPTLDENFFPVGKGRLEVPELDRSPIRWEKQKEQFPIPSSEIIPLPTETPKSIPKIQYQFTRESESDKEVREKRLAVIKESFEHSWNGYKAHAWKKDELRPVYGGGRDPFMGWGATLVDSLDTLWIMGMKKEFEEAVNAVKEIDFKTSHRKDIPLFETVIRYLGGLLSAYDLSDAKYPPLLDKALELAEILMGAFDTPNRMPITYYYWPPAYASQGHRSGTRVVLAELGSLSVEFTRLAQITKEDKYYDAIARITNELEKWQLTTSIPGLWPTHVDSSGCDKGETPKSNIQKREAPSDGGLFEDAQPANYSSKSSPKVKKTLPDSLVGSPPPSDAEDTYECKDHGLQSPPASFGDKYSIAALADSTYEYLPKEYLLLGGLNDQYRSMYEKFTKAAKEWLLYRPMLPKQEDILFPATMTTRGRSPPQTKKNVSYTYEASHLGCFAGGMFGLGAKIFGLEDDLAIASKLTDGCVWAYNSTTTGIMPESFQMLPCPTVAACEWNETRYYDALDPFEEYRQSRLQMWRERQASKVPDSTQKPDWVLRPSGAVTKSDGGAKSRRSDTPAIAKRDTADTPPADVPTKTENKNDNDDYDPEPTFLPHKDYAEQRIKEERLPLGVTEMGARHYLLRPEAIESVFIMYRITGDETWREKGWAMFQAIEKATRTDLANSAIKDVTSASLWLKNEMESFWLGETLKYFYLLFSDPQLVSLDEYVFNTEAHPFKRPS